LTSITDFYDPYLYELGAGDADAGDTLAYYRDKVGHDRQRILDIGAGIGRFAIALAEGGHSVLALDQSARMVDALERRSKSAKLAGTLSVQLRPFGPRRHEEAIDVAIAPDDFLLHLLSSEALEAFFRDLASWLVVGGRFLTDIRSRDIAALERAARPPFVVRAFSLARDDRGAASTYVHVSSFEAYEVSSQLLETTCQYQILDAAGEVTRSYVRVLRQRVHTSSEVRDAAARAGFVLIAHTARNRSVPADETAVGGSFEFCLREQCVE